MNKFRRLFVGRDWLRKILISAKKRRPLIDRGNGNEVAALAAPQNQVHSEIWGALPEPLSKEEYERLIERERRKLLIR